MSLLERVIVITYKLWWKLIEWDLTFGRQVRASLGRGGRLWVMINFELRDGHPPGLIVTAATAGGREVQWNRIRACLRRFKSDVARASFLLLRIVL
jgi:hypothetical protein